VVSGIVISSPDSQHSSTLTTYINDIEALRFDHKE